MQTFSNYSSSPFTKYGYTTNAFADNTGSSQIQFSENNLFKATNVYQQFDKKGNIFENRLYAKTSINQVKLAIEHAKYSKKMQSKEDEEVRINHLNA